MKKLLLLSTILLMSFNLYSQSRVQLVDASDNTTVDINGTTSGAINLNQDLNSSNFYVALNGSGNAPYMGLSQANGNTGIYLDAESAGHPELTVFNNSGFPEIILDADVGGDSRITTDELLIRGGSDLAEHFDVASESGSEVPAGLVVSIDPSNPGKLIPTTSAYDKGVVGVISGANGVEAGMMMGQAGTIADGDYPIALVGRVYVKANQLGGDIKPGDFLTSSDIRGEAMKVKKAKKAKGAVIGKALTSIDENGYVLVLVNLH